MAVVSWGIGKTEARTGCGDDPEGDDGESAPMVPASLAVKLFHYFKNS
jgi:hypothetical protein